MSVFLSISENDFNHHLELYKSQEPVLTSSVGEKACFIWKPCGRYLYRQRDRQIYHTRKSHADEYPHCSPCHWIRKASQEGGGGA